MKEKGEGHIGTILMLLVSLYIFALLLEISDGLVCCVRVRAGAQMALDETLQQAAIRAYPRLREGIRVLEYDAEDVVAEMEQHIEAKDKKYLKNENDEIRDFRLQCSEDKRVAALGFTLQIPFELMGRELFELQIPIQISATYALKGE